MADGKSKRVPVVLWVNVPTQQHDDVERYSHIGWKNQIAEYMAAPRCRAAVLSYQCKTTDEFYYRPCMHPGKIQADGFCHHHSQLEPGSKIVNRPHAVRVMEMLAILNGGETDGHQIKGVTT